MLGGWLVFVVVVYLFARFIFFSFFGLFGQLVHFDLFLPSLSELIKEINTVNKVWLATCYESFSFFKFLAGLVTAKISLSTDYSSVPEKISVIPRVFLILLHLYITIIFRLEQWISLRLGRFNNGLEVFLFLSDLLSILIHF